MGIYCFRSGTKGHDKSIEDLDNDRVGFGVRGYTGNKGASEA